MWEVDLRDTLIAGILWLGCTLKGINAGSEEEQMNHRGRLVRTDIERCGGIFLD